MKLLRYGDRGCEKPGLLGPEGEIRDLSSKIEDIKDTVLSPEGLEELRKLDLESLPLVEGTPRLGPPIANCPKFIGIGLNYADHATETGMPIPEEPVIFTKATSCISGPNDDIPLPQYALKGDFEVELAFVIGQTARHVAPQDAMDLIAGYCLCNDVSERGWQKETTGQWIKGKSSDGFGPLGPWLVTTDEIPAPHNLALTLDLNATRMQDGNTSKMIFKIPEIISTITRYMTLVPGDVVATGTPAGVGWGRTPPSFLKPGDEIRLSIQGLGEQNQKVVSLPLT